jgi:molybdate transport system substrate-binding protein
LVVLVAFLAACSSGETVVTVSAASSLTEIAEALEAEYEAAHPDVDVRLNIAGSATLVAQIRDGAPADILLAADELALPADNPLVNETIAIATNQLVVAVPVASMRELQDLEDPDLRVVACDPSVPCGRLAERVIENTPLAPFEVEPDSLEQNVRLVRQRLLSGEADVGFIYRTDLRDQPDLKVLELGVGPEAYRNVVTVSRLTDDPQVVEFMDFLAGSETVSAMTEDLGFGVP